MLNLVKTGSGIRFENVSPGKSIGNLLLIATAAVIIFVDPGPTEDVAQNLFSSFALEYAIPVNVIFCS